MNSQEVYQRKLDELEEEKKRVQLLKDDLERELMLAKRQRELLSKEKEEFSSMMGKIESITEIQKKKIKLNVGGQIFVTTQETLTAEKGHVLSCMFSGNYNTEPDEDGEYLIDRDGTWFRDILNYLRDGDLDLSDLTIKQRNEFLHECQFYQIRSLLDRIQTKQIQFLPEFCSRHLSLTDQYKRAKKVSGGNYNNCGLLASQTNEYTILLVNNCKYLMVGFSTKIGFDIHGRNYNRCGYFLYCAYGNLWFKDSKDSGRAYLNQRCDKPGTMITVKWDQETKTISYSINGEDKGLAFEDVFEDELYPSFDIYDSNCEFTLL